MKSGEEEMTGGRRANQAGRAAEWCIAQMLAYHGVCYRQQVVVGRSVFEKRLRVDFLIDNLAEYPDGLVIESKWQDREGTTEQKLSHVLENIHAHAYRHSVLLVLNGGGFSPGALSYLRTHVDGDDLIGIFDFAGLLSWLQRKVHPRLVLA